MSSQFQSGNGRTKNNPFAPGIEASTVSGLRPGAPNENSSRRRFLRMTVGGTLVGLTTAAGVEFVTPHRVLAQSKLSPDAALQELMDGNKRFTSGRLTACEHALAILKQNTIEKQDPFAAVLSCA